jgi:outer membrane protein assembly factor BamB
MGDPALKQMRCDGYSSPVLAEIGGRRQIVHFTGGGVQSVAADTGELLWNFPLAGGTREIVPPPIVQGDHVFVGSAYCPTNLMLKIENGKPTEEWRNRNLINHFSDIVYANGGLFGSNGNYHAPTFRCMDFATGERKWEAEFRDTPPKAEEGEEPKEMPKEQAFVLAADGKLLILTAYGELVLAKASTEAFEPLGRMRLAPAGGTALKFWPPPALAGGRFFCQNTGGEIWCVDLRK